MWMSGYLAKTSFAALVRWRIDRGPGNAGEDDDVALAVQLLGQPFGRHAAGFVLVDMDVVGAGFGDLGVIGEDHHALVAGVLDDLVERGRRDREDDDRLGAGLNHGVDLLDLALGIGAGDLDLQVDLVGHALMRRHRLDHVGGLGLPVIADVAHAEEDLVLAGSIGFSPFDHRSLMEAQASTDSVTRVATGRNAAPFGVEPVGQQQTRKRGTSLRTGAKGNLAGLRVPARQGANP